MTPYKVHHRELLKCPIGFKELADATLIQQIYKTQHTWKNLICQTGTCSIAPKSPIWLSKCQASQKFFSSFFFLPDQTSWSGFYQVSIRVPLTSCPADQVFPDRKWGEFLKKKQHRQKYKYFTRVGGRRLPEPSQNFISAHPVFANFLPDKIVVSRTGSWENSL